MKDGCDLMRKGMKVFAALIAAATASAMSMTAFAASVSVGTTYSGDDVTVTADVTGAAANEEVAFLVHATGATTYDNSTIYYIEQDTADEHGAVSFSFTDAKSKIITATGSTVRVGTASIANNDSLTNDTKLKISKYTVNYTVDGIGGRVLAADTTGWTEGDAAGSGSVQSNDDGQVTFTVIPDAGYALDTVKKDGTAVTTTATDYSYTYTVDANCSFVFAFKKIEAANATLSTSTETNALKVDDTNKKSEAITYAKVDSGAYDEIGFVFAKTAEELNAPVAATAKYFKALAVGSDGSFAIQLSETAADGVEWADADRFLSDTMYAKSYVKVGDAYTYGDLITLNK